MTKGNIVCLKSDVGSENPQRMTVMDVLDNGWIWCVWVDPKGIQQTASYPPEVLHVLQ